MKWLDRLCAAWDNLTIPRTFESVLRELHDGLRDGSIVLDRPTPAGPLRVETDAGRVRVRGAGPVPLLDLTPEQARELGRLLAAAAVPADNSPAAPDAPGDAGR